MNRGEDLLSGAYSGSMVNQKKEKAPMALNIGLGNAFSGLESLELEDVSNDDIIKNVEQMINQQQKITEAAKTDKNAGSKALSLTSASGAAAGFSDSKASASASKSSNAE